MILSNSSRSGDKLYSDDVFSTSLYTGNGSSQTITNGLDLLGKGGMVWVKATENSNEHNIWDSARGLGSYLDSSNTLSQSAQGSTSFTSSGFSFGTAGSLNNGGGMNYASYSFRKAPKFFDVVTWTGNGSTFKTITHNLSVSPGMILVKCFNSTTDWFVYHRSLSGTNVLKLNTSDQQLALGLFQNVNSSTFDTTLNNNGQSYVAYIFAHDTSADGLIQCGSYTGTGNVKVTLGWEPQYLLVKRIDGSSADSDWNIYDNVVGGLSNSAGNDLYLCTNNEYAVSYNNKITSLNSDGVTLNNPNNYTYVYLAIRRSNKPPTSASQVHNLFARTGTSTVVDLNYVGFSPDLLISTLRTGNGSFVFDRLRGSYFLTTQGTSAEQNTISYGTTINYRNNGVILGADTAGYINQSGITYVHQYLKRAPEFMDIVHYTGTASNLTIPHQLKSIPDLIIIKNRSTGNWAVYSSALNNTQYLVFNSTAIPATDSTMFNSTTPTTTQFTVGTNSNVNSPGANYISYMFATKNGISKIGVYTGNGSSQTINCNFTTGAKFIMIKRTDSTGDWYFWDAARGIVAANDPHLSFNAYTAEVITDDSVDPDNTGFIVNQNTATNINVNNATYLYLAIA